MIRIVAPSPDWAQSFSAEADRWRDTGMAGLVTIHHIGSTSVSGLPAKPIIDMLPVFDSRAAMEAARDHVLRLGYEWKGAFGLPGRRYCRRDDPATGARQFQAHCYVEGSPEVTRHLAFRDVLRGNAPLRAAYAAVKGKCAALHPGDMDAYGACKSNWIKKVEARALADLDTSLSYSKEQT